MSFKQLNVSVQIRFSCLCCLGCDLLKFMFSFEGNYRTTPEVSLGGRSKKVLCANPIYTALMLLFF